MYTHIYLRVCCMYTPLTSRFVCVRIYVSKICIYRHDTGENVNQCLDCVSLITSCACQLAVCYCATSIYS